MKSRIFLFPAAIAVIFMSSVLIILSPVKTKTIIPVTNKVTLTEDAALDKIAALPEIIKEAKKLATKGSKHILRLENQPTPENPSYQVYFGEDKLDHTILINRYLVNIFTGQVSLVK